MLFGQTDRRGILLANNFHFEISHCKVSQKNMGPRIWQPVNNFPHK